MGGQIKRRGIEDCRDLGDYTDVPRKLNSWAKLVLIFFSEADELWLRQIHYSSPVLRSPAAHCTGQCYSLHANGCEVERFALSLNSGTLWLVLYFWPFWVQRKWLSVWLCESSCPIMGCYQEPRISRTVFFWKCFSSPWWMPIARA